MCCVKCRKQMDEGSVNVKAIVTAVVALLVVVIIVFATSNSATSELNKLIEDGDIDEAANYYLDKFEEKGKGISDKTLELLKDGIAQIETDYQAGDLTADEALMELVAYRPFKEAGVEEEYDDLNTLLNGVVDYENYIAEGDSYEKNSYGEFDLDECCYNYEYAYDAYYAAYEIANDNESIDGSEAADGLQKIKDYLLSMTDEYVENEYYIVAYLWLWDMSQMEYFQDDEDVEDYLEYVTPLKDEQVAEEEAEGYGNEIEEDETEEEQPGEDETNETGEEGDTQEVESDDANTYTLDIIDPFTIDYSEYVDVSNWRDAVVTKDMIIEPEYKTQYALAYELIYTYGLSETEITDRGAQGGDTLTIDFVGYVDGEEMEDGSATAQEIMLGSGVYVDGFEEGLLGAKVGDEVTIEITFPNPYDLNPELSGKEAVFEVTVLDIAGFDEVLDKNINAATGGEYETYEEYYADFIENRAKEYEELIIWQEVMNMVEELAVCEPLRDDFINTYLNTYSTLAEAYGMDIETLLYYYFGYSVTVDEFTDALTPSAEDYAHQTCAVLAIADMEGLTVDDKDVDAEYEEMQKNYYSEEAMAEAGYAWSDIKFSLLLDMVEECVYDSIQVQ